MAESAAAPVRQTVSTRQFLELFSAVMLPMFLAVADQTLLATATPRIAAELGGLRDTAWIVVGYLMAVTVTVPLYGRLGDRLGRGRVLTAALAVFAAGSLACGLAPRIELLIAARVLQGLGGGGLMVMSQALVGELVPPRERARFQGYFAINFSVASVSGPLIGGIVVQHGDWRWLFFANVPLVALAAWRLRHLEAHGADASAATPPDDPAGFDVPGVALFAATAIGLLLWITFGGHRFAWLSVPSIALAAATLACGTLLARREWRVAAPFLPVELLRDRGIVVVAVTVLLFAACFYGVVFFLPIYLQLGHGNSATASGLLLLPLTFGMVSGATLTGRTIARTGRPSRLPAFGMTISAGALLALAVLPAQPLLVGALGLLCGLGFGTVMPTSQVVIQTLAGRARLGAAAAVVSLARSLGSALGTACFAAVAFGLMHGIDLAAAARAATPEHAAGIVGAMRMLFGAVAATAAVTALWAARAPRLQI